MDGLKTVTISYTSENVTFLEGASDKIIVKEYMAVDKPKYYAAISQTDGNLKVTAGERPKGLDTDALRANVEIYLPTAYQGELSVETSSGNILSEQSLALSKLQVNSKSGSIELTIPENLGFRFSATTNSGIISAPFSEQLSGTEKEVTGAIGMDAVITIELSTTSGNIKIK